MLSLPRVRVAATTALLVTLMFAWPVQATEWGDLMLKGRVLDASLATEGGSSRRAAFADLNENGWLRVGYRGSTGGWTQSEEWLSFAASNPAIAMHAGLIDVVWTSPSGRVRYARSSNGGSRFTTSLPISPRGSPAAGLTAIARRNDVVAAAWADATGSPKRVRVVVSTDGGDHFGPVMSFRVRGTGGFPSLAIGTGVVHLSYFVDDSRLLVRRTLNAGGLWRPDTILSVDATHFRQSRGHLTASGDHAYIVYIEETEPDEFGLTTKWVRFRWTNDRGANWAPAADIESSLHPAADSHRPIAAFQDGELRVIWARCVYEVECTDADIFYRRRTAAGWFPIEEVTDERTVRNVPVGVGHTAPGSTLVMFIGANEPFRSEPELYHIQGTP